MAIRTILIRGLPALLAALCFQQSYADEQNGAAAELEGFTSICTLDESCSVDGTAIVAFGTEDRHTFRTLSGNFLCASETFGLEPDSAPEAVCSTLTQSHNASSSSSSSGSNNDDAQPLQKLAAGRYFIVSRSSGKVLAIGEASQDDGAELVQQDFNEQAHQIWEIQALDSGFYSVTASHSDKALEIQDWGVSDGAKLQQLPWMNNWNQHWVIEPIDGMHYKFASRHSGNVVDVFEMNQKHNGQVRAWTYWGGDNQHWRFIPLPEAADDGDETADAAESPTL